jgi:hypothetical protein
MEQLLDQILMPHKHLVLSEKQKLVQITKVVAPMEVVIQEVAVMTMVAPAVRFQVQVIAPITSTIVQVVEGFVFQ